MHSESLKFYERLKAFSQFSAFHETQHYQALPNDWAVVVTDVLGSTQAIEQGQYKQVNAVGVASMVALKNSVNELNIPFVFGGDGATACIPLSLVKSITPALLAAQKMSAQQFKLELRIGVVPMTEIHQQHHQVLVGKYQPHQHYQQAMFLGDGLAFAESLIKDPRPNNPYLIGRGPCANSQVFKGFECRWNEIPSPSDENISLLVMALGSDKQKETTYQQVLHQVNTLYGEDEHHHPLTEQQLSLTSSPNLLSIEAGIRNAFLSRFSRFQYLINLLLMRLVGGWLITRKVQTQTTNWGEYKQNVIMNTDYRKFDELLRMVISGTKSQRQALRQYLQSCHEQGKLVFGIHASTSSLMTCVVTDYNHDHVHFLDGANGGYAMAAKEMKAQLHGLK